jgi:glyoxylate reductase
VRVLTAHSFPGQAWEKLRDVVYVEPRELAEPSEDVEALVVAGERVDGALLDLLPSLRLVANYGVGYDLVDVGECARRGVVVTNTPGVLDAAVAELAFGLILATRRQIAAGDRTIRRGGWKRGWWHGRLAEEVNGSTLGVIGLGRIGSAVARRAEAFDMRVLHTRRAPGEAAGSFRPLDDLLRESDVVSIHVPLTAETHGLIDARRLALLRDGACLVNTARGDVVDQVALVRELVSGRISAGLDVFTGEPNVPAELLGLDNVVLTPHIGSATTSAREAMTRLVVDNVLAVEAGRPPVTPVEPGPARGVVHNP